jgi:hypothetical protein
MSTVMSQQLIKYLEAVRPSPEEAKGLVDQLIKRLEAVKPGLGEAKALVNRMKNDPSSKSDRQRLLAILEAEEAALEFLASWTRRACRAMDMAERSATSPGSSDPGSAVGAR